jgi:predicted TPR repeat methyltransferase
METTTTREPVWRDRMSQIRCQVESIRLPESKRRLSQDQEWCEVTVGGQPRRIRFHDYGEIYDLPGLYEQIFYEQLHCCSPSRVVGQLAEVLRDHKVKASELRVLDLGAGNGMVADELRARGVGAMVGVDIIPQARKAALRDRPGIYTDYIVADMTRLDQATSNRLRAAGLNCLTAVATLGFGDTPPGAFTAALGLLHAPGWVAFNIKETFLDERDNSGFAGLVRQLTQLGVIRIEAYRRYRHRRSTTGEPLHYVAVAASLLRPVPSDRELGI